MVPERKWSRRAGDFQGLFSLSSGTPQIHEWLQTPTSLLQGDDLCSKEANINVDRQVGRIVICNDAYIVVFLLLSFFLRLFY